MERSSVQEILNKLPKRDSDLSDSQSFESSESDYEQIKNDNDPERKTGNNTESVLHRLNSQTDPLFFEFFSIYTAQSVKQKLLTKKK